LPEVQKDHPPKSHSHYVLPKRWKVLLGGAGPGDQAVTNMYRPQLEADRALSSLAQLLVAFHTDFVVTLAEHAS
jgi:hypothetical protein